MRPRLAAIDLDGTLLRSDMTISNYSKKVIQEAADQGMRIVVATGRMFVSARLKAEELGIGDVPVICYTGAWIGTCLSGEILFRDGLAHDTAESILDTARQKRWFIQSFVNDTLCLPDQNPVVEERYGKYRVKPPIYLGEEFWHPKEDPTRLIIVEADRRKRDVIRAEVEYLYGGAVEVVYPGDDFMEIHKRGVSKGTALQYLCRQWGVPLQETVAFGNSENDVSMLKLVGLSYAVEGSEPEALSAAREKAPSNDEDGVAKTLKQLLSL